MPHFAALPKHAHHLRRQIDVVDIERGELAQTQPRRVEQLEDRPIAPAERRSSRRRGEQRRHLTLGQVRRHAHFALRRRHQRAGIGVDQRFALQVSQERAHGRELARRRGARLPAVRAARPEIRGCADDRAAPASRSRRFTPAARATCARKCERSLSYARTVCGDTLRFSARNCEECLEMCRSRRAPAPRACHPGGEIASARSDSASACAPACSAAAPAAAP